MATDSSSGTLPSSSRLTINSSSSIARSKLNFLTSTKVFSVILSSCVHPLADATKRHHRGRIVAGSRALKSGADQCGDVRRDRFLQALQIIAALEHRNNSPPGAAVRDIHQLARDPAEILRPQIERGERVAVMGVEARRDHDQLGRE